MQRLEVVTFLWFAASFFLLGLFLYLLYLASIETDVRGKKNFSPTRLGKVLKSIFSICLPDSILLYFANFFVCCGYVGNSCLESIYSDEDERESRKMAKLAATLGRNKGQSRKKSKYRKRDVERADEEALFSRDSMLSDMENNSGTSDNQECASNSFNFSISPRRDNSKNMRSMNVDAGRAFSSNAYPKFSSEQVDRSFHSLPTESERMSSSEVRDNRLDLSQHSSSNRPRQVSRETLQALIAAEDRALVYRQTTV